MAIRKLPDRELLRQLLHYDAATGVFTWLPRPREMFRRTNEFLMWNKRFAGKPAGWLHKGYLGITIGCTKFAAHRLAWLYVHGEPIPDDIDHIDRDGLNNRIDNLRAATQSQNFANTGTWGHNTSGIKGVRSRKGRFEAYIKRDRRAIHLGTFATIEEAAKARQDAAVRLFGEFARQD